MTPQEILQSNLSCAEKYTAVEHISDNLQAKIDRLLKPTRTMEERSEINELLDELSASLKVQHEIMMEAIETDKTLII